MNRRWKNHGYELVYRDRGAGRSDLTLALDGTMLLFRDYSWDQQRLAERDIRALCMIGKLREVSYREVGHEPEKKARK